MRRPTTTADRDDLDAIKAAAIDIYPRYVELKRIGRRYVGRCPFHADKTPSFYVFEDGGCKCFGCGFAGDVLKFVQEIEHVDFPGAKRIAADLAGVPLSAKLKRSPAEARAWAARRRQAERQAADLTAWREERLAELRERRNRMFLSETGASAAARTLLATDCDDEHAWDAIWAAAQDDLRGDALQAEIDRLAGMSPAELATLRARTEARAA